MRSLLADLRYGLRLMARNPGFTSVAVLSLAVGIGANTAVFSLVDSLLFRPLPVQRPRELVSLYTSDYSGPAFGASSYPDYLDFKNETRLFSGLAAYSPFQAAVVAGDRTERALAILASGNYFQVLGVAARAGRVFGRQDDTPAGGAVAVLADRFARRLGGEAGLIGQTITINGQSFGVIGIAPIGFNGILSGFDTDVWIPAAMLPQVNSGSAALAQRGSRRWMIAGRLAPGATVEQAQARVGVIAGPLAQQYPESWLDLQRKPRRLSVVASTRLGPQFRGTVAGFMSLLMAVVGLVLLVACANVANLLLARATGRTREVAVRLALGAARGRLVRQLLTESLLLSAVSGAAGLLLAVWITRAIGAFTPPVPLPVPLDPSINVTVLFFTTTLSMATGLIFGLVPALRATRPDLVPALKSETGQLAGGRRFNAGHALVVMQVALSLLLLVAAGLFVRTLQQSQLVHLGFDPDRVVVTSVDLAGAQPTPERATLIYQEILDRLRQLPDAERVGLAALVPLGLGSSRRGIAVEGYQFRPGEDTEQHYNVVSADYFATMSIPVVRGRSFTDDDDRAGTPPVVMINETFGRRFWPGEDPLGKRIKVSGANGPWAEVVGVTEDGHYVSLLDETLPYFFVPFAQSMRPTATVHVRTRAIDPASIVPAIRRAVRDVNANISLFDTGPLTERIGVGLLPMRLAASWLSVFGAIATLLAAIGLYGVLAHTVNQRRREIGVRVALGADPRAVQALFVAQGMRIVGVGIAVGLAGAFGVTRLLSSFLYGVSPTDAITFAGTSALLTLVALAATYLPARRAARLDPIQALRQD